MAPPLQAENTVLAAAPTRRSTREGGVAACCTVFAACCPVLQRAVLCCSVLSCVAACCAVLQRAVLCCSVLPCVAACHGAQPLLLPTGAPTGQHARRTASRHATPHARRTTHGAAARVRRQQAWVRTGAQRRGAIFRGAGRMGVEVGTTLFAAVGVVAIIAARGVVGEAAARRGS